MVADRNHFRTQIQLIGFGIYGSMRLKRMSEDESDMASPLQEYLSSPIDSRRECLNMNPGLHHAGLQQTILKIVVQGLPLAHEQH